MKTLGVCVTIFNIVLSIVSLCRNFFIIHLNNTSTIVLAIIIFIISIIVSYRLYKTKKINKSQMIFAIVLFLIEFVCVSTFTHFDEGYNIKVK